MRISQLATLPNLSLAWRRITTGGNHAYKQLFRELYVAYEVALDDNLADLRDRLLGGAFEAKQPERIYLPKSSGLHRPLSLLHLEDQIVLQAFANLAAKRLHKKRAPLQFNVVFSNILEQDTSIYFFRRWQQTFAAFKKRIRRHYADGLRWVADFDLAAFYDTVSHELLLNTIYPKAPNGDLEWLRQCLGTWSSERASSRHGHGIPQGPIASDFLAECFLLPIDLAMRAPGYTRYVDDVRIFGRTEDDVRSMVVHLERRCREHGLIPQTGKFAIRHAAGLQDAMGMLPSIADPQRSATSEGDRLGRSEARLLFASSLEGKPARVGDKTRLRYVLYRADPDPELLRRVLRLIPLHPEHADVFFRYLGLFDQRVPILRLCLALIDQSPYPFVRGEAWLILARYLSGRRAMDVATRKSVIDRAITVAKKRRAENFTETLGACHFLAVSESVGRARHSNFLRYQPPLLQAFAAAVLPDAAFDPAKGVVRHYLESPAFEPGLATCARLQVLGRDLAAFGRDPSQVHTQVVNTLRALGAMPRPGKTVVDPIAETLKKRYGVPATKSWHTLLKGEYVHALGMLKMAEAAFNTSTSFWLSNLNSFHHAVFMALQAHLAASAHPAACTVRAKDGKLIDFGVMLDANGPFSRNCTIVGDVFRAMNTRRNSLPVSHPYEKKTERRTRHLSIRERNRFVTSLSAAYPVLMSLLP